MKKKGKSSGRNRNLLNLRIDDFPRDKEVFQLVKLYLTEDATADLCVKWIKTPNVQHVIT